MWWIIGIVFVLAVTFAGGMYVYRRYSGKIEEMVEDVKDDLQDG